MRVRMPDSGLRSLEYCTNSGLQGQCLDSADGREVHSECAFSHPGLDPYSEIPDLGLRIKGSTIDSIQILSDFAILSIHAESDLQLYIAHL